MKEQGDRERERDRREMFREKKRVQGKVREI